MKKLLIALLALGAVACGGNKAVSDRDAEVVLHTTAGDIRILLDGRTPRHRDNFLELVRAGHYDSVLFHRVIENFMIQTGDPTSRHAAPGLLLGEGDTDYELDAEIRYPALAHTRGAVAAARRSDEENPERRSSGGQFYIVWGQQMDDAALDRIQEWIAGATDGQVVIPDSLRALYRSVGGTPHLDGQYTVFGHVTEGLEVVEAIQRTATDANDRPTEDIRIIRAEIVKE